jgi:hypothetical protein
MMGLQIWAAICRTEGCVIDVEMNCPRPPVRDYEKFPHLQSGMYFAHLARLNASGARF